MRELEGLGLAADEFGIDAAEIGVEVVRDVIRDLMVEADGRDVRIRVGEDHEIVLGAAEVSEVLGQLDERFSRWSARSLAEMEERRAARELERAAERARREVSASIRKAEIALLETLADHPDREAIFQLGAIAARHHDPAVRRSAIAILKTIDHPQARKALHEVR
jgi:hypothetical protein